MIKVIIIGNLSVIILKIRNQTSLCKRPLEPPEAFNLPKLVLLKSLLKKIYKIVIEIMGKNKSKSLIFAFITYWNKSALFNWSKKLSIQDVPTFTLFGKSLEFFNKVSNKKGNKNTKYIKLLFK